MTHWAKLSLPKWALSPPNLFDIVTGYYPESKPKAGTPAHRPCLVTAVYEDTESGGYACEVTFGTKSLKTHQRAELDIIIINSSDLDAMGLPMATRFDLDACNRIVMEWNVKNFKPWRGYVSPKIGALILDYQKEYAWIMAKRGGV